MNAPAFLVSAIASGQGKTTVTAALARHHRQQGRRVHVFKTGADFLDALVLERAAGQAVHVLDLWMVGEEECRRLLCAARSAADLVLIEGVMGLYDGTPSSADLARGFDLPVLAVIDVSAMDTPLEGSTETRAYPEGARGETIYRCGSLTASYVHAYVPSWPPAIAALLSGLTP